MSIERHDGKNMASLSKLWILLKSQVQDTKHIFDEDTITADILHTGVWDRLEFIPGECSFQEVQTEDDQGPVWEFTIQTQLHKDRKVVTSSLKQYVHKDLIILLQDRNDETKRLIGEVGLYEHHARLTYIQAKELKGGRNSYDIIITGRMSHPATYYEGIINE